MARSQINWQVREVDGDVRVGASCTITRRTGGANASIWTLETGGSSSSGTTTTDANGYPQGWLDEGSYNIQVNGSPNYTRAIEIVRGDGAGLLADGAITEEHVPEGIIESDRLADDAITAASLINGSVTGEKIATDAVTTNEVASNAVSDIKVASGAIDARALANGAITAPKFAAQSVTTEKIADDAVSFAKFADSAITDEKFQARAITTAKVADDSVPSSKIADDAISLAHLQADVIPIGFILPWAGYWQPQGGKWLSCHGHAISRTTYSALFAAIGTAYGAGDGSTTFNVPDLRGRMPFALNPSLAPLNARGADDGAVYASRQPRHHHTLGTLSVTGNGYHQHYTSNHTWEGAIRSSMASADRKFDGTSWAATTGGGSHPHNHNGVFGVAPAGMGHNSEPFETINYIIRIL